MEQTSTPDQDTGQPGIDAETHDPARSKTTYQPFDPNFKVAVAGMALVCLAAGDIFGKTLSVSDTVANIGGAVGFGLAFHDNIINAWNRTASVTLGKLSYIRNASNGSERRNILRRLFKPKGATKS